MPQIVPVNSSPNQTFTCQLQVNGQPLTLTFNITWSSMAGYWVMTVSDVNGNVLLDSIPLITGWWPGANLLAQQEHLQIGEAFIINNGNSQADYPLINDLGTAWSLLWDSNQSYREAQGI
jgi:hypothetical protein